MRTHMAMAITGIKPNVHRNQSVNNRMLFLGTTFDRIFSLTSWLRADVSIQGALLFTCYNCVFGQYGRTDVVKDILNRLNIKFTTFESHLYTLFITEPVIDDEHWPDFKQKFEDFVTFFYSNHKIEIQIKR